MKCHESVGGGGGWGAPTGEEEDTKRTLGYVVMQICARELSWLRPSLRACHGMIYRMSGAIERFPLKVYVCVCARFACMCVRARA